MGVKVFCKECIKIYELDSSYLGKHGEVCDFCGNLILTEFRCAKCNLLLVLRWEKRYYWCSDCHKPYKRKEIENMEFLRISKEKKSQELKKCNKKLRDRRYKKRHPKKCKQMKQRYRERNQAKIQEKDRNRYKKHKLQKKLYRFCNKDYIRTYQREWCRKKKDMLNAKRREKRLMKKVTNALKFIFDEHNFF